ncbi:MAG: hypothetical protein IH786_07535 [Proteobacteria bacterium]|nr:hypothetical protein [Pseudomonadota bacterium]
MFDCATCKYEEFFLSSWPNGDPAMVVDFPANSTVADTANPTNAIDPDECKKNPSDPTACMQLGKKATKAFYPDDPSNVYHSYVGDHTVYRILHAGANITHVHHQHAHQWLHSPNSDKSHYLDSQLIIPGATYTLEMVYNGSGNRNQTVGDSIFHCHFYPHFAMGMWSLWRVHDVFEAGTPCEKNMSFDPTVPFNPVDPAVDPTNTFCTGPPGETVPWPAVGGRALPDGELARGSWIPAMVPLPTIAMAPLPAEVSLTTAADNVNIPGGPTIASGRSRAALSRSGE